MKFLMIHLSDIHFREGESNNPVLPRTEQIIAAAGSLLVKPAACFVVVSGDIAFSGRAEEYVLAEKFLTGLSGKLKDRFSRTEGHPIFFLSREKSKKK
jgi:3',5'-cyclic AMP phosphodiesterase CpdA